MKRYFAPLFALALMLQAGLSQATLVYSNWISNNGDAGGNYVLTINHVANRFDFNLTVTPWNAEPMGIFFDLGNTVIGNIANVDLSNVSPSGKVSVYKVDDASGLNQCSSSNSCKLNGNGITVPDLVGGDWELIFSLGVQGFDTIKTFAWSTSDFGLGESAFGIVAIRAQQLCPGDAVLPGDKDQCEGSDRAYALGPDRDLPEPASHLLLGLALGMVALGLTRRA